MTVSIAVFTRDLRVEDLPMLTASASAAQTVPLFVLDPDIRTPPRRQGFLYDSLAELDQHLRDRGGRLILRSGPWAETVAAVAGEVGAETVNLSTDVSAFSQARVERLRRLLPGAHIRRHPGVTVVDSHAFERPYLVFSAYYRRWLTTDWRTPAEDVGRISVPTIASGSIPHHEPDNRWRGGADEGNRRLERWLGAGVDNYASSRNDLLGGGTSQLSPYLHFGCVSAASLAARVVDRPRAAGFLRQLCWRDFFAQLLCYRPSLATTNLRHNKIEWAKDTEAFGAWQRGQTGYPLVDAAMRQLQTEGWMPNRARMVVASFLTKDLRIAWQWGAGHFMEMLVDADVASNQLNWQWVAGTGTGGNPSRIMNPTLQQQKFDPHGEYVSRWLSSEDLAREPIIDHADAAAFWRAGWS